MSAHGATLTRCIARSARGAAMAMCIAMGACGGASRHAGDSVTQARRAAQARQPEVERAGGVSVLAVPRATEGTVHLAVFVDAGSRDAAPPQLATAVAWIAAARTESVHARVEPDGTEWSLECTRERLAQCASELAGVLALREVDGAELSRVRETLADVRRRALTDDARTADALALAGVLGDEEAGAFGRSEDDARVDAAMVARFAAAHYGPSRALFVATGDVGSEELRDAVTAAMNGAPAAAEERAERAPRDAPTAAEERTLRDAPAIDERVRVVVSESDAVSVALRVGSAGRARAIAAQVAAQSGASSPTRVEVLGFAVRGGGGVLLRSAGDAGTDGGVVARVKRLVASLETARRETPGDAESGRPVPDALDELARAYGRAFVAGDTPPGSADDARIGGVDGGADVDVSGDEALAVGVVLRGGRAPSLRVPDPDALLARDMLAAVTRARELALAGAAPELRGTVTTRAASAVLANGARIEVRAMPGAAVRALAVRFASDAAGEPASVLGRRSLLAHAIVAACADDARRDDVELRALVDARSFGLVATGRDEDALLRALRCALDAQLDDGVVELTRRLVVASLGARVDAAAHARSLAGRALAPETPAVIAPGGDEDTIAAVPTREVRALLADARRGARIAVALAGDVDAVQASARLGRRLATLDAGAVAHARGAAGAAADDVIAAAWRGPGVRVVVTLRADAADAGGADVVDARAFALVLAERLAAAPGVRFVAADGDVAAWGAFAWIALDVDEGALAALPATVRLAMAALGAGAVGGAAVLAVRTRLGERMSAALASPAVVASTLAAARVEGRAPRLAAGSGAGLARVVDALTSARVRYVIARPAGLAGAR